MLGVFIDRLTEDRRGGVFKRLDSEAMVVWICVEGKMKLRCVETVDRSVQKKRNDNLGKKYKRELAEN